MHHLVMPVKLLYRHVDEGSIGPQNPGRAWLKKYVRVQALEGELVSVRFAPH